MNQHRLKKCGKLHIDFEILKISCGDEPGGKLCCKTALMLKTQWCRPSSSWKILLKADGCFQQVINEFFPEKSESWLTKTALEVSAAGFSSSGCWWEATRPDAPLVRRRIMLLCIKYYNCTSSVQPHLLSYKREKPWVEQLCARLRDTITVEGKVRNLIIDVFRPSR